ncbi:metalloregulator ArsR/SmtB family transcription factor [Patescibacteria group bacterium]|nr:metalloregulator ArsR/SmtB family transcription factor [Patescibacteria group bacterium]
MVNKGSPTKSFRALGSSARTSIIERLSREGTLTTSDLSKTLRISLPATLKHTKILEQAGLIQREKRNRAQYCSIHPEKLDQALEWLLIQKIFWDVSLSRLEKHITYKKHI